MYRGRLTRNFPVIILAHSLGKGDSLAINGEKASVPFGLYATGILEFPSVLPLITPSNNNPAVMGITLAWIQRGHTILAD